MAELKADRKIIRARVQLQKEKPFFSYLVLNLNMIPNENYMSMGIDSKGNCYYNPKWVEELSEEELKAVLCHEVMHVALFHLIRVGEKDKEIWNYATDIAINNLLVNNSFSLPEGLVPSNNSISLNNGTIVITDIDKKVAEEIYNELCKVLPEKERDELGKANPRFDEHKHDEQKEGNGLPKEQKELKDKWKRLLSEAITIAKQKGDIPSGMERVVDIVLNERVNWKNLLYKFITRELAFDYTYSFPSKKSQSCGVYMPSVLRENIEAVVSIDTSGSIDQKQLSEFLAEIVAIAKSFNNLSMTLIVCDCMIQEIYPIQNGNIAKILELKLKGGGGTSHEPVYEWIKQNKPNTKFVINFTDGYTTFPDRESTKTIWFLTKGSCNKEDIPFGDVIKVED